MVYYWFIYKTNVNMCLVEKMCRFSWRQISNKIMIYGRGKAKVTQVTTHFAAAVVLAGSAIGGSSKCFLWISLCLGPSFSKSHSPSLSKKRRIFVTSMNRTSSHPGFLKRCFIWMAGLFSCRGPRADRSSAQRGCADCWQRHRSLPNRLQWQAQLEDFFKSWMVNDG